jgi:hypothetical protein
MAEIGLDISHEYPKPMTTGKVQAADVVITMGCGDACPVYPGKRYLDWDLPDAAGLPVEKVRSIRDEIGRRVQALLAELDTGRPGCPADASRGYAGLLNAATGPFDWVNYLGSCAGARAVPRRRLAGKLDRVTLALERPQ